MIEIELERGSLEELNIRLLQISGRNISPAMRRAAKRAATHARTVGTRLVRGTYTIDAASVKAATSVRITEDGAVLRIAGFREGVDHYKARKRRKGIFVSVKKGSGDIVARSFDYSNTYFQREGDPRLPIKRLFGPAVPQLFGNDAIKGKVADAAMQKYEERLRHEIGRAMGV